MWAALAENRCKIRLSIAELAHQAFVACGFLDGVEVGALDVLENSVFERGLVVDLYNRDRNCMEADQLGRAPAPLAGNDLVSVRQAGNGPNDDRLHDPALADRCSQAAEVAFGKLLARISRIRAEKLDRHLAGAAAALDNLLFVSDI